MSKKQETRKQWYKFWVKRTKPKTGNDTEAFLAEIGGGF